MQHLRLGAPAHGENGEHKHAQDHGIPLIDHGRQRSSEPEPRLGSLFFCICDVSSLPYDPAQRVSEGAHTYQPSEIGSKASWARTQESRHLGAGLLSFVHTYELFVHEATSQPRVFYEVEQEEETRP